MGLTCLPESSFLIGAKMAACLPSSDRTANSTYSALKVIYSLAVGFTDRQHCGSVPCGMTYYKRDLSTAHPRATNAHHAHIWNKSKHSVDIVWHVLDTHTQSLSLRKMQSHISTRLLSMHKEKKLLVNLYHKVLQFILTFSIQLLSSFLLCWTCLVCLYACCIANIVQIHRIYFKLQMTNVWRGNVYKMIHKITLTDLMVQLYKHDISLNTQKCWNKILSVIRAQTIR